MKGLSKTTGMLTKQYPKSYNVCMWGVYVVQKVIRSFNFMVEKAKSLHSARVFWACTVLAKIPLCIGFSIFKL